MITLEPPRTMALGAGKHEQGTDAAVWRAVGLSRGGLGRFVRVARAAVGLSGEVEVLLAGDRRLRQLNRNYRGKDKATDVLSFPAMPEMVEVYAGDLAVSLETAQRQAEEHGHSLRDEVRVLLLHGLLHLAGMDHEVDGGVMAAREGELRKRLGLKRGLIARVEGEADACGMTSRKAKATATAKANVRAKATAKANAGVLRFAQDDGDSRVTSKAKSRVKSRVTSRVKVKGRVERKKVVA
jgi:probable rRNA maturation factor